MIIDQLDGGKMCPHLGLIHKGQTLQTDVYIKKQKHDKRTVKIVFLFCRVMNNVTPLLIVAYFNEVFYILMLINNMNYTM